jgi:hypothetical protein
MSQTELSQLVVEFCDDTDLPLQCLSHLTTLDELVEVLGIIEGDSVKQILSDNMATNSPPVFCTYSTEDRWPI